MVIEVAGILETGVERINCSSDTTTEQLFGSVVPQYKDNQRTFEWMDGKLIEAIEKGRWILLDEINLLPPQVLESLVPLLNGSAIEHGMAIPGQSGARKLKVKDVYIFATMNPAAEGGGRTKLSRSIKNLFTTVELDPQSNDELFEILKKLFRDRIPQDVVGEDSIRQLFDVFKKVQSSVELGEIKGASRRQRFNLRDLVAVRDIVAGSVNDQLSHYSIVAASSSREELSKEDRASVIDSVLRNALQLVFKHRFENQDAQACIQSAIDDVIKPPELLVDEETSTSIDTSVSNLVRIGRIYLNKNPNRASNGFLVHTRETVAQLELLAAASQSAGTVLLEGPTCSRKTCLVKELAALTGRPLLLLSLHREYEVSDLTGQWLPAREDAVHGEVLQDLLQLRDRITGTGVKLCEQRHKEKQIAFYRAIKKTLDIGILSQDEMDDRRLFRLNPETIHELVQGLTDAVHLLEDIDRGLSSSFAEELHAFSSKLSLLQDAEETVVFRFVTSDLVKALKSGTFILFDNINAAPPEVIERVLSLFEEKPFLNLYEHAEGEKLSRDDGIHPDTRLFATADRGRINTYKLSNPLLNRMIKIWLPEIDAGISKATFESLEGHEVVEILSEKFASHAGGNMAARLLSFVHARVKEFAKNCEITIAKDSGISFRTLLEASSLVTSLLKNDQPVFNAVVWGAWRIYASVLEDEADWIKLKEVIRSACEATAQVSPSKFYAIRHNRDAVKPFLAESENIRLIFASVVHISLKILFGCIMKVSDMDTFEELILYFLNRIAVKLYPREETMIRRLMQEIPRGARNRTALKHHCEAIGCRCVKEFFKAVTPNEMQKVDYVCDHPEKLLSLCKQLVAYSAYTDWQKRRFMIQDMADVLQELNQLLEAVPSRPSQSSDVEKVKEVVRQWRAVEDLFVYFAPLEDESFASCYERLLQAQNGCTDTAVSYNLEKLLSERVSSSDTKLRGVIANLLKNGGHPVEDCRQMALQIAMTALRWRTMLMIDDRLLTIHRDTESSEQIFVLQKLLCESNIIRELQKVVDEALRIFKATERARGLWQQTVNFVGKSVWPLRLQNSPYQPQESDEDVPDDDDDNVPDVKPLIEQLDVLMRTKDAEFVFSDEWTEIVEFHSELLNVLSTRREKEGRPLNLYTVFPDLLSSRMKDRSQYCCINELSMIWLGVCFSEWRDPIPCQIILCTEENISFDPFKSTESSISAAVLCAELGSRQGIAALVSLVVFEKTASNADEKTGLSVRHHCHGQSEISQNTWLKKWMEHQTEYEINLFCVQRLSETKLASELMSHLGSGMIDCFIKLQSCDPYCRHIDPILVFSDTTRSWHDLMDKVKRSKKSQDPSQVSLLYHGILKLDSILIRLQHGGIKRKAEILSMNDLFSKQPMARIESEIKESIVKIKNLATRGDRESASVAYSFLKQFEELKRFPSEDLVRRGSEVEHAIRAIYKDLCFLLDLMHPILGLREFLIKHSLGRLDATDPDLWTKCNSVSTFVSSSIAYFNAFLIVDGNKIRLDRMRSAQEFEDWQDSLDALVDHLDISKTDLEANNFDIIFLRLKDRYFHLLQTEVVDEMRCDSFQIRKDASSSSNGPFSDSGSDGERLNDIVLNLTAGYEKLWLKARKITDSAVMNEAASALSALTRQSMQINKSLLVQYQNRFNSLEAELDQAEKKNARAIPLSFKECETFKRNRSICLQNCDFSLISSTASPENRLVENPLVDIVGPVASRTEQAESSMKTLMWMAKSTAFHARLQKSIDVLRRYGFEDKDLSQKKGVLEELSDLGIFLGALSIRMKFHAFNCKICDDLIQDAAAELMNAKANFLLKEQHEMLHPSRIQEVEDAVAAITSLCAVDKSCSMLMAHPVFNTLRSLSMDLSSCLNASAVMAEVASSFDCPGLSVEDIAVLFCADFNRIQSTLMNPALDEDRVLATDDPTQKMRPGGRLVSFRYQMNSAEVIFVFANTAKTVNEAVTSFLHFDWESVLTPHPGVCEKAAKEAVISLQFIALSILLTKQNFSFLSSLLQLSDSVEEQRTAKDLKMMHKNTTDELQTAHDEFEEVRKQEIFCPVFDSDFMQITQWMHNAEAMYVQKRIEELTTKKEAIREQMIDANDQLRRLQSNICLHLSCSLRDLLLDGLRCLSRIFGRDAEYFESHLATCSEISANYTLFIADATRAGITIFRDTAKTSSALVDALEQWCRRLDAFKREDLSSLNIGDPFRNALQSLCTVASLGARRIRQLISPSSAKESVDIHRIAELERRLLDRSDTLRKACMGCSFDEDSINKSSEDLLNVREGLCIFRGRIAQNGTLRSAVEYTENTVLRIVGYYNAHIDAQCPLIWYRNALEKGRLPPIQSPENSSFQQDLDGLPSLWKSCAAGIRSAIKTNALSNPFQLLSLIDSHISENADLYQCVSCYGHLFLESVTEMHKVVHNPPNRPSHCGMTDAESQCFNRVFGQCVHLLNMDLVHTNISQLKEAFATLESRLGDLSDAMTRMRRDPKPLLVRYMGNLCKQWYSECILCITTALQKTRGAEQSSKPLSQRLAAAKRGEGDLKSVIVLADFQDVPSLQATLSEANMTTVLTGVSDHEIEVLKSMASFASQLLTGAVQKTLKKWKEYHTLPSAVGIEVIESLVSVSKNLIQKDVAHLLSSDSPFDVSDQHILDTTSSYLMHLCRTISRGIRRPSTSIIQKLKECSEDARALLRVCRNQDEVYQSELSALLDSRKRLKEEAYHQQQKSQNKNRQLKRRLGQQLRQKAKETAKLYAAFWSEVDAGYQSENQPKWYEDPHSVFLKHSKRLEGILEKQKSIYQHTAATKPINLKKKKIGLKRVQVVVKVEAWNFDDGFFESDGSKIEITCIGGQGGPFHYDRNSRPSYLENVTFIVSNPLLFRLVFTFFRENQVILEKPFPLPQLHRPHEMTIMTGRPGGCRFAFRAMIHRMYIRKMSSSKVTETRNPAPTEEAYSRFDERLRRQCEDYDILHEQFAKCLENEKESQQDAEETDQTSASSEIDQMDINNAWHVKAMMKGKQFAESISQALDEALSSLYSTKDQTQHLDAIRDGIEKLSIIFNSPPDVPFGLPMRLIEEDEPSLADVSLGELEFVWTTGMQSVLQQLKLAINELEQHGSEAKFALLELYATKICQHAVGLTSEEELKIDENHCQEWKSSLERFFSKFDQEMLLHWESQLEVALSIGRARTECMRLVQQLHRRMEVTRRLRKNTMNILRGTQLRHSSKIMICEKGGTLSLSSLDCTVDFGAVLHQNDVPVSTLSSHVYTVEVENRTNASAHVRLSALDPSSQLFRSIGLASAVLCGKTSWHFKFSVDADAVGKIAEMWKITSDDGRLNARFKMIIEVQRLAVQLNKDAIDFGTVVPSSRDIKQTLKIDNVTDFSLLVKSQVPFSQAPTQFTISPQSFHLGARSSRSLTVTMRPGNVNVKIDSKMILGIVGNMKHIPIKAQVVQPQYELVTDKGPLLGGTKFRLPVVTPGKKAQAAIRIRNRSTVPVVYRLTPSSSVLKVIGGSGTVGVHETSPDVMLSMRGHGLREQQEILRIQIEGCVERELIVEGKWMELRPQFLKKDVDFEIQRRHLDAIEQGSRSVTLEAVNIVENRADTCVRIYPPSSEHFTFDQPDYVLSPCSRTKIEMYWEVKTLQVKKSTVVFCTERQKKLEFAVHLKMPSFNELQFCPRNLFFGPLDVRSKNTKELKIETRKRTLITTRPAEAAKIQSLQLKSKMGVTETGADRKGPWNFGSDDMPPEFQPRRNCVITKIELKTGEAPGWIVETMQIQSEDDYLIEDDLSLCLPLRHTVGILAFVGQASSAAHQMMQLCAKSSGASRPLWDDSNNYCLPNLHLILAFQNPASTFQTLSLLILSEIQVLNSEWTLSERKAAHVIRSNPEEVARTCAQYAGNVIQESDETSDTFQNIEAYFESVRELCEHGHRPSLGDTCLPSIILEDLSPDLQRMMVALYMLRADCQEDQQWNAAVACLSDTMPNMSTAALFDKFCREMWESCQEREQTIEDCIRHLKSILVHDTNERVKFLDMLEGVLECSGGVQDSKLFDLKIAKSLTEWHRVAIPEIILNLMTLKTWSIEEIDLAALRHFLVNAETQGVIDGLCSETPGGVFDAFCALARSGTSGSTNAIVQHLLDTLPARKQDSHNPVGVVDTPMDSMNITRVILQRENLEDLVDPLSLLHSTDYRAVQQRKRHILHIVIKSFFGQMDDTDIPNESLTSLKEIVLKIVNNACHPDTRIVKRLGGMVNPSRRQAVNDVLSRIMTFNIDLEESHELLDPLKNLVVALSDLKSSDEDGGEQKELLDKKARSLKQALVALKPETLSKTTSPFELASRVLQFVASLKNAVLVEPEVMRALAQVAASFSWEGILSLCRILAQETSDFDRLHRVLDLVEETRDDENSKRKIIETVLPEEHHSLLVCAIQKLMNDAVVIEEETRKEICKVYDEKAFDTLICALKIARGKRSVCQMDKDRRMTLSGLLEIRSFIDQIASFENWRQCGKKSDILKEIFFSFCTCSIPEQLSSEARAFSKMALLLSLHRYTTEKFWKQKEALCEAEAVKLEFKIANVPEISHPEEHGSEDDDKEDSEGIERIDEVHHNNAASPESSIAASKDDNDKKWFLPVSVPSRQLTPVSKNTSQDANEESKLDETKSDDLVEPSIGLSASSFQSLERVESTLEDISKRLKVQDFLKSAGADCNLITVTFRDIATAVSHLKETTEQWCFSFEEAIRFCHLLEEETEKRIESRVVCAGIDIVFLFQFLRKYLDEFSLLQMPDTVQLVCRRVVHCLNAIPRKTLSDELRNLLEEAGATETFHGYTIDFDMPSTNNYLSIPNRQRSLIFDRRRKLQKHQSPRFEVEEQDSSDRFQDRSTFYDFLKSTAAVDGSQTTKRRPVVLEATMNIKIDSNARIWTPSSRTGPIEDTANAPQERRTFKLPEHLAWNTIGVLGQTTSSGERIQKIEDLRENLDLFTGAVDDDDAVIHVNAVGSSREATRRQVEEMGNFSSLYDQKQEISAATKTRQVEDPVHKEPSRLDSWTYQLLLDNAFFARGLKTIMRRLEKSQTELYKASAQRHTIEWCLLVDNSGSMITKEHQTKEALVLVMEMLRRLEFRFAVALFGDSTSQRMQKLIMDPFTIGIGQQIIDSFTFDEGTFPASAVKNVAQKVWPSVLSSEEKGQCHRVMLMIVDGLTQERRREDYLSVCGEKDISLAVLNIHDDLQKDLMNSIRALWKSAGAQFEMLHVKQIDSLPEVLVSLMEQQMRLIYQSFTNAALSESGMKPVPVTCDVSETDFSAVDFDTVCLNFGKNMLPVLPEQFTRENFFECDYRPDCIPFAEEMSRLIKEEIKPFPMDIERLSETLQRQYDTLLTNSNEREHLKTAETAWMQATERLGSEISRVTEALESYLPQNIHTRKRADVKGPTIYIPGYIKHLATQGSEKKIFANKKGGGKAEYAIVLLLDISVSAKHSTYQACALETLFLMIEALRQMNIETFSVILFAEHIYPIKLPDMVWEDVCIAMLMKTVEQIHEPSTMDADALLFAAELLESSNVRGPKKIFIVTDGYGSSGVRLAAVLTKLEASGIDVLAMSVGPDISFVKSCYNKWITAAFPHLLPNAIERMENAMQTVALKQNASLGDPMAWLNLRLLPESTNESVRDILEKQESVFSNLSRMRQEREARLIRGNRPSIFTVDICFCIDCTKSMSPWIKAAVEQIQVRRVS